MLDRYKTPYPNDIIRHWLLTSSYHAISLNMVKEYILGIIQNRTRGLMSLFRSVAM